MIKIFMQLKPDPNHAGCAGTRASAGVPGIDPASVPGPSGRDGTTIPTATDRQGDRPKPVMPPQALVDGGPEAKPGAPYPLASEAAEAPLPAEESRLVKAQARITALENQELEQKDIHHRLLADFANQRNRTGQETRLAATLAEKKLLLEMLPILDSLERCLAAHYPTVEDFRTGVSLIHKQFIEALHKAEVEEMELKIGDPFNAQQAEALTTTSHLGLPDGAVAAVFERGYRLRQDLLRPARVIVNHIPRED